VIISAPQRTLLDLIVLEPDGVGSAHVSNILEISIQSASIRLKTLYEKGYVTREEIASESGGIEFIYKAK
jgi:predicted transcriptional regulator